MHIKKALILVGGKGARLQEAVSDRPKPMADVAGKPFLEHLIVLLRDAGVEHLVLAIGYKGSMIREYFKDGDHWGIVISCVEEALPLGTGGAIRFAAENSDLGDEFFVLNGDSYFDPDLAAFAAAHERFGGAGAIALRKLRNPDRSGVVVVDGASRVVKFNEKQVVAGEALINGGVYILTKRAIQSFPQDEVFSIETAGFPRMIEAEKVLGFVADGYFIDIGVPESYQKAREDFAKNRHLHSGPKTPNSYP